jgi:hypothetical protein
MREYKATDNDQLKEILDMVHDRPFEIDNVYFDENNRCLKIPLTIIEKEGEIERNLFFLKVWRHNIVAAELIIHNVISHEITDKALVGIGEIDTIEQNNNSVEIQCNVPVTIKIRVEKSMITLVISDDVVSKKNYYRLPGL